MEDIELDSLHSEEGRLTPLKVKSTKNSRLEKLLYNNRAYVQASGETQRTAGQQSAKPLFEDKQANQQL